MMLRWNAVSFTLCHHNVCVKSHEVVVVVGGGWC